MAAYPDLTGRLLGGAAKGASWKVFWVGLWRRLPGKSASLCLAEVINLGIPRGWLVFAPLSSAPSWLWGGRSGKLILRRSSIWGFKVKEKLWTIFFLLYGFYSPKCFRSAYRLGWFGRSLFYCYKIDCSSLSPDTTIDTICNKKVA